MKRVLWILRPRNLWHIASVTWGLRELGFISSFGCGWTAVLYWYEIYHNDWTDWAKQEMTNA